MNKAFTFFLLLTFSASNLFSQENTEVKSKPRTYEVEQAIEAESLFPIFFSGGFHISAGYRYKKFRLRASIINGGSYNAENVGIDNMSKEFKRYYQTSPGVFFGYNIWKNLDIYAHAEFHNYEIEQKSSGNKKDMYSTDLGGGIGYQFFVWKGLYLQPAVHIYARKSKSLDFGDAVYKRPNVDIAPTIRLGYRLWSK